MFTTQFNFDFRKILWQQVHKFRMSFFDIHTKLLLKSKIDWSEFRLKTDIGILTMQTMYIWITFEDQIYFWMEKRET